MGRSQRRPSRSRERGATAVVVAVVVGVLCMFLVLTLNAGHGFSVRAELQNAGDSAALAGAADIGGNSLGALRNSLTTARNTALSYAGSHTTDNTISVSNPTVWLGTWHSEDVPAWFEHIPNAQSSAYLINAVQVAAARDGGQSLTVFGGGVLGQGHSTMDVVTRATAARFAPCRVASAAPLAFASGQIDADLPCGSPRTIRADQVGLTVYSAQPPSAPSIQSLLMTRSGRRGGWQCDRNYGRRESLPTAPASVGLQSGDALSWVAMGGALSCLDGQRADVAIVDAPSYGGSPSFAGTHSVVTWARVTISNVDPATQTMRIRRGPGPGTPEATPVRTRSGPARRRGACTGR